MRSCSLLIFCLAGLLTVYTTVNAQEYATEKSKKQTLAELNRFSDFAPELGDYRYNVLIDKLKIGSLQIELGREDEKYHIHLEAKAPALLNSIFNFRYVGRSVLKENSMEPARASVEQQSGKKRKNISIDFPRPNRVDVVEKKKRDENPLKQFAYSLESPTFVVDPFSALFLVQSLAWQQGNTEIFDIFTGSRQYELQLYCSGKQTIESIGIEEEVWVIEPRLVMLTAPFTTKLSDYEIFLSTDPDRTVMGINGTSKYGNVSVELAEFTAK